jgi:uncharacterized protein (DUF2336 family)
MVERDIQKLLALAADRSAAARAELAYAVTDFLVPDEHRLTEHQRALMQDILGKLVLSIELDVRANLAQALIRAQANLPDLEKLLANDEIEVARPVLERSNVLADSDLIEIIAVRTEEHRLSIALREHVSQSVSDALVRGSGPDVIEALLRNDHSELSRHAMEYLVGESKRLDRFQEPLLLRHDLPVELAYRMYWWVSAALRKHILTNFVIDADTLDTLLHDATLQALAEHDPEQSAQGRAMRLAAQMIAQGEASEAVLLRTLRQNRITLFIALLATIAKIDFTTAWRIASDRNFESFVVLGRALELSQEAVTSVVLLLSEGRAGLSKRSMAALSMITELYRRIDLKQAQGVVRLWQRDAGLQRAIQNLEGHD